MADDGKQNENFNDNQFFGDSVGRQPTQERSTIAGRKRTRMTTGYIGYLYQ